MDSTRTGDIVIAGAGPVGATCALLFAAQGWGQRVCLVDARPREIAHDPRAMALNEGSRLLLERLGAWPEQATAITTIHVSQRGRLGRTLIRHDDYHAPALGYVARYDHLMQALNHALERSNVQRIYGQTAQVQELGGEQVHVEWADSARTVPLLITAEGGGFHDQSNRARRRDYQQSALVAQVIPEAAPSGWAYERFTSTGPIALLPMQSEHCLVWCGLPLDSARRAHLTDQQFCDELHAQFGDRVGGFRLAGERRVFPLGLNAHEALTDGRVVRIGNAAQTLHPVAGQGLNLGLRDAACLTQEILQQPDPAHWTPALQRFVQRRRLDRGLTMRLTDTMARVFATASVPLQHTLGLSLGVLDLFPASRHALAKHMMLGQRA